MRRAGFTLLEVVLAMAIALLLLLALYVAVNTQLRLSQAAREVLEHGTLARSLQARIAGDISAHLGPVAPERSQQGTGSTGGGSASGTAATSTAATTQSSSLYGPVQFNLGVQGDASRLVLFVSRLHRDPRFLVNAAPEALAGNSDLRRITYWLAGGADAPLGLARQVVHLVTSDELMSTIPPDIPDEPAHVIAEEVRGLSFSYFDGTSWLDTWDGTQPGADGTTPLGPPPAIAITLTIATSPGANGEGSLKTYRHVVAIPTANGTVQQSTGAGGIP